MLSNCKIIKNRVYRSLMQNCDIHAFSTKNIPSDTEPVNISKNNLYNILRKDQISFLTQIPIFYYFYKVGFVISSKDVPLLTLKTLGFLKT